MAKILHYDFLISFVRSWIRPLIIHNSIKLMMNIGRIPLGIWSMIIKASLSKGVGVCFCFYTN